MAKKASKEMQEILRLRREIIRLNEEQKKRDMAARALLDANASVVAMMIERAGGRIMIDISKYAEMNERVAVAGVPYKIHKTKKNYVFRMKTNEELDELVKSMIEDGEESPTEGENGEENSGEKADA